MRHGLKLVLAGTLVAASACYHATIETGLTPSAQVVEKSFASAWIGGLVPPSAVATASQCKGGVSKVETQLSFVNMLVGFLTLSIYTPMNIKVTCAQGGRSSIEPTAPTIRGGADDVQDALGRAAQLSWQTRGPVYVEF
jgi:putative copper export protein